VCKEKHRVEYSRCVSKWGHYINREMLFIRAFANFASKPCCRCWCFVSLVSISMLGVLSWQIRQEAREELCSALWNAVSSGWVCLLSAFGHASHFTLMIAATVCRDDSTDLANSLRVYQVDKCGKC
jgi:hypothetical protein